MDSGYLLEKLFYGMLLFLGLSVLTCVVLTIYAVCFMSNETLVEESEVYECTSSFAESEENKVYLIDNKEVYETDEYGYVIN